MTLSGRRSEDKPLHGHLKVRVSWTLGGRARCQLVLAMTADALVLVGARLAVSAPVALATRQCFCSALGPLGHRHHLAVGL